MKNVLEKSYMVLSKIAGVICRYKIKNYASLHCLKKYAGSTV